MIERLVHYGVQYAVYFAELGLVSFLIFRGQWKRLRSLFFYLVLLLAADAIARPSVLYYYGVASLQYAYFYWLTDFLLALGAFLLLCAFFRRACKHEEKLWHFLRIFLAFVFILVLGISCVSLSRNFGQLFTRFLVEFEQNLYFTCLVLNTLLYVLMQQIESADDELGLLVCGLGIQFAGPAANLALVYLTSGEPYTRSLWSFVMPLCTMAMLLTWFYAVARMPKKAEVRVPGNRVSGLAVAAGREA